MELEGTKKLESLNEEISGKRLRIIHQKFIGDEPQAIETVLSSGTIRAFARLKGSHQIFEGTLNEILKSSRVDLVAALYILGFSLSESDHKTAQVISLEMIYTIEAADAPDWSYGKKWIRKVGMDFMPVNRG